MVIGSWAVSSATGAGRTNGGHRCPFKRGAAPLGIGMQQGIDTYFAKINAEGGVNGNQLALKAYDDQYAPLQAAKHTRDLVSDENLLAAVGNVGTPTAAVTIPIYNQGKTLLFGAFTGAGILRRSPPDRYVINYRASYVQETAAMVDGLLSAGIQPEEIAFFTQNDSFGDAGYNGAISAMQARGFSNTANLVMAALPVGPGISIRAWRLFSKRQSHHARSSLLALSGRQQILSVKLVKTYLIHFFLTSRL